MNKHARCGAVVLLLAAVAYAALPDRPPAPGVSPWTFRADFAHGLTGWMSFPLAQDIGFDPTLYTADKGPRTVLVRQVQALGEKQLLLGVVRPIEFDAGPELQIQLQYALSITGDLASAEVVLAGEDGQRYSSPLPREAGGHAVSISAGELKLPPAGAKIQAVLILAHIENPPQGSTQRLTVSDFVIHAERPPAIAVLSPAVECSEVDGDCVSRNVLAPGSALDVQLGQSAAAATVELENPAGERGKPLTLRAAADPSVSVPLGSRAMPGLWTATVSSGPARTAIRVLVAGAPPPHPRILLRKERLDQLRTMPQFADLREQIHRRAQSFSGQIAYNADAGKNIAHLPGGTGLHAGFVGELKSYFKLLESYANAIAYCALDYSLNGDEKSFESSRRALLTVARWETWTPPRFSTHGLHTYYEVGVFAQRVALGYDLIAPRLTPEEKKQVADAFWTQLIEPTVKEYFLYNRMPTAGSNWMANSLGGAIAAAVVDDGDTPEWKSREGVALAEMVDAFEHLLKGLFPGDGSESEPAGYENFAMQGLSWGVGALDSLGIHPRGTKRMWEGFWWPYYAMVKPDLVLDTGDFDGRLDSLPGFAWGAEHAGIPALRDFYGRSATQLSFSGQTEVQHTGRKLEAETGPLDLVCCSTKPANYSPPPTSRIFPKRGSAVMRSGWDPEATVISMRAGPWFNHEHHDEGSFQVAAYGEKLVSEAGYSSYYDDPNYPIYFIQASGHNTVLIDDDPFSQMAYNGNFWRAFDRHPHFSSHVFSSSFNFVSADLTSAYAGRLTHYERDFIFVPPDLLVVRDRITADAPHVYTWLLHAPSGAGLSTQNVRAVIQMPRAAASMLAVGPASAWKVRSTSLPITAFDNLDEGRLHTPREFYLESPSGREAAFLVGLHFAPGRTAETPELERLSLPSGEGVQQDGAVPCKVVFRTGTGALQLDGLSTDGKILAVRGKDPADSWLSVGARTVKRGGTVLFRSQLPLDAAWQHNAQSVELDLHLAQATDIEAALSSPPASVRMDGKPAAFAFQSGMIVIRGVKKGNHRVSIAR